MHLFLYLNLVILYLNLMHLFLYLNLIISKVSCNRVLEAYLVK